jgi:hypothetical protein
MMDLESRQRPGEKLGRTSNSPTTASPLPPLGNNFIAYGGPWKYLIFSDKLSKLI